MRGRAAEAVLTGTDASNWGTGQVLWLDGGREEASLAFTHAERRRPINWRELLGIVRVCQVGGERLRGKTVLVETDNMAAKGAASKLSSKSADMQELVRRLMRLGERHGFEYWRLDLTKAARKVGAGPVFLRERVQDRETYEADPRQFWSVDHIVGASVGTTGGSRSKAWRCSRSNLRLVGCNGPRTRSGVRAGVSSSSVS